MPDRTKIPIEVDEITAESLIRKWGFFNLIEDFKLKGIDLEVFKELTLDDIDKLIPHENFGLRIKFRTKLLAWKREQVSSQYTVAANRINTWVRSIPISIVSNTASEPKITIPVTEPNKSVHKEESKGKSLNLLNLLEANLTGRSIIINYKKDKNLSKSDRQYVVNLIAEHWIYTKKSTLCRSDYSEATEQIKSIFPGEDLSIYLGTTNPRGKLAEKYYTLTKKLKKAGVLESRYNKRKYSDNNDEPNCKSQNISEYAAAKDICDENLEEIKKSFTWLQKNNTPESLVIDKWNQTFNLRRKQCIDKSFDVTENWPILKQNIGIKLIELDFEKLYPGKNLMLFSKWEVFKSKILKYYEIELRDPHSKTLLTNLPYALNDDSKNYILIILLNAILIPPVIKLKKENIWKPTILDGQNALVIHIVDKSKLNSVISKKKSDYEIRNLTIQPVIVVVGETKYKLKEFYIYFNDKLYPCESFLKSLSVLYQMLHVLNFEYAPQCIQVWHFIEEYFYEKSCSGKKSTALMALLHYIKN